MWLARGAQTRMQRVRFNRMADLDWNIPPEKRPEAERLALLALRSSEERGASLPNTVAVLVLGYEEKLRFTELVAARGCQARATQPHPCDELPGYEKHLWCIPCQAKDLLGGVNEVIAPVVKVAGEGGHGADGLEASGHGGRGEPPVGPVSAPEALCEWLVSLDDEPGSPGAEERRSVTLTRIIEKAKEALAADA